MILRMWWMPCTIAICSMRDPVSLNGVPSIWIIVLAQAPWHLSCHSRKLDGGTFQQQKLNSVCSGSERKTPYLESYNTREFVSGPKTAVPTVWQESTAMGICTRRVLLLLPTSSSKLLQNDKAPLRSHCELGKLTMKLDKWIEVMHYKYTTPLSLKHGKRWILWLLKTHLILPWFLVETISCRPREHRLPCYNLVTQNSLRALDWDSWRHGCMQWPISFTKTQENYILGGTQCSTQHGTNRGVPQWLEQYCGFGAQGWWVGLGVCGFYKINVVSKSDA